MTDYPGQDPDHEHVEPASGQGGSAEPTPGESPPQQPDPQQQQQHYPPPGQPYPSAPPYPSPPGQHAQQPYGQQPYGQQYQHPGQHPGQYGYGQPYPYAGGSRPNHPQAGLALGLGLGGVIGAFVCGLPLLLSPFAWAIGHRVRREIRESRGQYDGDGMAQAGMILGIVGTVLLVLAVLGLALLAIVLVADSGSSNV
jgi:hypothetical protein